MGDFDLASGIGDILSMALKQTGVDDVSAPRVKMEDPNSLLNAAADSISTNLLSTDTQSLTQDLISQLSSDSQSTLTPSPLQPQATLPSMSVQHSTQSMNGSNSMSSPTFSNVTIKSEPVSSNQYMYTQGNSSGFQDIFNPSKTEFGTVSATQGSDSSSTMMQQPSVYNQHSSSHSGQPMGYDIIHEDIDLDDIFNSDEPEDMNTANLLNSGSQLTSVPNTLTQPSSQVLPSTSYNTGLNTMDSSFTSPTLAPSPVSQLPFIQQPQMNGNSNITSMQPQQQQQAFNDRGGLGVDFNGGNLNSVPSLPELMDDDLSTLLNITGTEFLDDFSASDLNFNPSNSGVSFGPTTMADTRFQPNGGLNGSYDVSRFPPKNGNLQISRGLLTPENGQLISNASHTLTHPLGSAINGPAQGSTFTMRQSTGGFRGNLQQHQNHFKIAALSRVRSRIGGSTSPVVMSPATVQPNKGADEDSDDEDEPFVAADTYANYSPAKLKIGRVHPDPIVESSSLSSVEPPQVWFDLKLPSRVMDECLLSSLQLEAVVYACQQHMNILSDGSRAGFLVGDGAGVGKGRTVAGIIYQNYLEGRKKALWLSVSNDLKYDAIRDLRDLGAKNIKVYSLNKFHYGKISGKRNGRVRKGVIFATYSSLIGESSSGGKYRTRFNQILHWLGSHYEGVIVFDECHKAKNLVPTGASKPSKTGLTVLQLQKKLPKARIVYCSATGASEPRNMAYMSRLGIWGTGTQFKTFQDFIKSVERRGVGAMEIVAMDMKLRGMYIARQLSFSGVTFSINEVQLEEKFIDAYDASVKLWIEARRLFQEAADMLDYDKKKLKSMWGQFWGAHQRFFKYMCIAAKVPETIRVAKKAVEEGKCVVIGLQSTGEARTLEQLEQNDGELSGFISTTKGVLETLIRRHFPTPSSDIAGINWSLIDNDPTLPRSCRKRRRPYHARQRGPLFQEDDPHSSDSDSSGSPERSDSAVESSSDGEDSSDGSGSSSSDEGSSDNDSVDHPDYNPFGSDPSEPWLQKKSKKKAKKRKLSPSVSSKKKKKNFSITAPPTSRSKGSKTKTGFNSKSLKFEPVQSPKDSVPNKKPPQFSSHLVDRRQSIAVAEGITRGVSPVPTPSNTLGRKQSLQVMMDSDGGQSLIDAMSSRFNSGPIVGGVGSGPWRDARVKEMKDNLLHKIELLSPHLPTNTLDELIDGLGGPRKVAEMTGRRGRVVGLPDGSVQYQLRSESDVSIEMLNIAEKQRFMDGEKVFAIISEAASSGISLQADRRVKNHRRRVHITLELPWSADRAIQQFGRTHRSNQVSAPEYIFLISQLSGEQRFASIVAKRLESLGALTHGDRRATESRDLSKYNLDTKAGHQSLEITLKSVLGIEPPMIKTTEDYNQEFFDGCRTAMIGVGLVNRQGIHNTLVLDKDASTMSRFLNRILGLPVQLQNQLFNYFSETLAAVVKQAKKMGKLDEGILDFGAAGEFVEIVENEEYIGDPAFSTATTQLHKIRVERGMSFSEAVQKLNAESLPGDGFCVSKRVINDKQTSVLMKAVDSTGKNYLIYRPNTGCQSKSEKLSAILKKYQKVSNDEAEKWWKMQYDSSENLCNHAYWQGKCRKSTPTNPCEVGCRRRAYYVLSGSVLGMWTHIEGVFMRHYGHNHRMQIVRVRVNDKRLVGILVPRACVVDMKQTLARVSQQAQGTLENPIAIS